MLHANKRIALIGECLIELTGAPFGTLHQTFGGDSLNTALYLARLAGRSVETYYVSVLGADALSDEMIQRWETNGIDTGLIPRDPDRLPGLYLIQNDARGERAFPVPEILPDGRHRCTTRIGLHSARQCAGCGRHVDGAR
jgi:2-dehydro-3-deoxygluconokinase